MQREQQQEAVRQNVSRVMASLQGTFRKQLG